MKKVLTLSITLILSVGLVACSSSTSDKSDMPTTQLETIEDEPESKPELELEPEIAPREEAIGKSNKDIDEMDSNNISVSNVKNDVTGNWRVITITNNADFLEYARSYYDKYFESDKEIHAIINLSTNETIKLSKVFDVLDVSFYEYIDGEEYDAKLMFSGSRLSEYWIYLDNGDIEQIK